MEIFVEIKNQGSFHVWVPYSEFISYTIAYYRGSEGNEGKTSKVRGKKTAKIPHSLTSLTANYDASFR